MLVKVRKVEGIVVGRKDFFEQDKLIVLLAVNEGKIRLIAKGVRNQKSSRLGKLELGSRIKALLVKGKSFDIITEVEAIDSCFTIRKDAIRLGGLIFLCELVNCLLPENEENDLVYRFFLKTIESLKEGKLEEIVKFEFYLIETLGFGISNEEKEAFDRQNWQSLHEKLRAKIEFLIERPLKSLAIFR